MITTGVLRTVFRELTTTERSPRVPEPDLVMDDSDQVDAYAQSRCDGSGMEVMNLFHCAQICEVIRSGDTVVDLGCGPATTLAMAAKLNPSTEFIGVDLSSEMLEEARSHVDKQKLTNVDFRHHDITKLTSFPDDSVDSVVSTLVLHHLPDIDALDQTFAEISRVLKPGGGLYVVDFGRLKSEKSIHYFAYQDADRQHERFNRDYLNSLRAAFTKRDFQRLTKQHLKERAKCFSTALLSFLVAVKSPRRSDHIPKRTEALSALRASLSDRDKQALNDLVSFFRRGGLASPLLA